MQKTKSFVIGLIALLAFSAVSVAQTNVNPPTVSFIDSVQSFFSTFNTNLITFSGAKKGSFWTGVDSIQGAEIPLANSIGFGYRLHKIIDGECVIRNSGVAGTLTSSQVGVSANFVTYDAKFTVYIHEGYNLAGSEFDRKSRFYTEFGARVSKALTDNTFAGVGIGAQLPNNNQIVSVHAGFTF